MKLGNYRTLMTSYTRRSPMDGDMASQTRRDWKCMNHRYMSATMKIPNHSSFIRIPFFAAVHLLPAFDVTHTAATLECCSLMLSNHPHSTPSIHEALQLATLKALPGIITICSTHKIGYEWSELNTYYFFSRQ